MSIVLETGKMKTAYKRRLVYINLVITTNYKVNLQKMYCFYLLTLLKQHRNMLAVNCVFQPAGWHSGQDVKSKLFALRALSVQIRGMDVCIVKLIKLDLSLIKEGLVRR